MPLRLLMPLTHREGNRRNWASNEQAILANARLSFAAHILFYPALVSTASKIRHLQNPVSNSVICSRFGLQVG